jgi:hypothetical protein
LRRNDAWVTCAHNDKLTSAFRGVIRPAHAAGGHGWKGLICKVVSREVRAGKEELMLHKLTTCHGLLGTRQLPSQRGCNEVQKFQETRSE